LTNYHHNNPLPPAIFITEHAYTLIEIQHRTLSCKIRHWFYFTRQDIEKGDNMSPDLAREVLSIAEFID